MTSNPFAAYLPPVSNAATPATETANPYAAFLPKSDAGQLTAPTPELGGNRPEEGFLGRISAGLGIEPPPPGRSPGEFLGEMLSNVPESAGQVGADLWSAVTNPIDTLQAVAGAAAGGGQLLKEKLGLPVVGMFGEHRDKARAVGDFYNQRYGGGQEFLDTVRTDPVGAALDIGGAMTGGAGLAARAPGAAGRVARAVVAADPTGRVINAAGKAVKGRRARTPRNREFIAAAPTPENLRAEAGKLYDKAEASGSGPTTSTSLPMRHYPNSLVSG